MKTILIIFTLFFIYGCSATKDSLRITQFNSKFQVQEFDGNKWVNIHTPQSSKKEAQTILELQEYNQYVRTERVNYKL